MAIRVPGRQHPSPRVVLTAAGVAGFTWGGDCQGTTGTTCTVIIPPAGAVVSAAFPLPDLGSGIADQMRAAQEALNASTIGGAAVGPGNITLSLSGPATDLNTVVTYRAEPNQGAAFHRWSGRCQGTDPVCTKTIRESLSTQLRAYFGWTVTVELLGGGRVTGTGIDCPTTCSGKVSDPTVTLQAVNAPGSPTATGWAFIQWGGDCAPAGSAPTCTLPISGNKTVTASFLPTSIRVP